MKNQSELEWFLSYGITLFERSSLGPQLDKISMEAFTSRRCHVCGGCGVIKKTFKTRTGKKTFRTIEAGSWCFKCNGTGSIPVRLTPEEQSNANSGTQKCNDTDSVRAAVPDDEIRRYALVSRRLARMSKTLAAALIAGYGDEGSECALTVRGRAWAATPLTRAGRSLLAQERLRKRKTPGVEPERALRALMTLAALDGHKPNQDRTKLLAEAGVAAQKLLDRAEAMWIELSESDAKSDDIRRQMLTECRELSYG
jgi:hypothetical protein